MPNHAKTPPVLPAKTRILQASILLFARRPFSETSLRDIATEAQVDVAYVHRSFGSKVEIFRQALQALHVLDATDISGAPISADRLIDRLCDLALLRDPKKIADVEPLHLIIQSCSCCEAREILSDFVETHFARPLADSFGHTDVGRAMFAISLLSGFVTMRVALGQPALQTIPEATLKAMLSKALHDVMTA